MSSRLASISAKPTLREYAQGAAQSAINPVADFIAPTVPVATSVGNYKVYTEKHRFKLPQTLRGNGGRATELSWDVSDGTFNCQPHALDYPVDNLELLESAGIEDSLQEGATMIAEVAGLVHEKTVIDKALAAVGAGTDKTWSGGAADPVDNIDEQILAVIKAAKYGSLMSVGIVFGATAWRIFKNSEKVRNKFVTGNNTGKNGAATAIPQEADASRLFLGNPDVRTSYMVVDSAPEGKPQDISFVLDSSVLIFARTPNPTRRDPSFMKTFRLMGKYMVPGSYVREDGRVEVAKFDWSEDVRVTNSSAIRRLNIS